MPVVDIEEIFASSFGIHTDMPWILGCPVISYEYADKLHAVLSFRFVGVVTTGIGADHLGPGVSKGCEQILASTL
jgi:hypothetical protein